MTWSSTEIIQSVWIADRIAPPPFPASGRRQISIYLGGLAEPVSQECCRNGEKNDLLSHSERPIDRDETEVRLSKVPYPDYDARPHLSAAASWAVKRWLYPARYNMPTIGTARCHEESERSHWAVGRSSSRARWATWGKGS